MTDHFALEWMITLGRNPHLRDKLDPDGTVRQVWEKGKVDPAYDPDYWRRDEDGNLIKFFDYGNRDSEFGWEKHHLIPVSKGGTDDLFNLIPLQWRENVARGDSGLHSSDPDDVDWG